ncbi:MAG TPA: ATP-dependent metallopeptidase FtsH/Yme1/Tma family protein, partial [Vicinamibacterales bacterium]|nr:ATP-dependent metallopeptidase FtsH/Yme1/Tma family protein [Vicinamibacterales bacterium]
MQFHVWYVIAAIFGVLILQQLWTASQQIAVIPYSEYLNDLKAGKVDDVKVSGDYIQGDYKEPQNGVKQFVTTRVPPDIAGQLQQYNVKFSGQVESNWLSAILSWILPTLLFLGVWYFLVRRMANSQGLGGGFMSVGRSKAKVYVETDTRVSFADVAGVDEAKEELQEVVAFLKNPQEYGRLG